MNVHHLCGLDLGHNCGVGGVGGGGGRRRRLREKEKERAGKKIEIESAAISFGGKTYLFEFL